MALNGRTSTLSPGVHPPSRDVRKAERRWACAPSGKCCCNDMVVLTRNPPIQSVGNGFSSLYCLFLTPFLFLVTTVAFLLHEQAYFPSRFSLIFSVYLSLSLF